MGYESASKGRVYVKGSQKDNARYWTQNFVDRCSLKEAHVQRQRTSNAHRWGTEAEPVAGGDEQNSKLKGQVRFKGTDGQAAAGLQELQ